MVTVCRAALAISLAVTAGLASAAALADGVSDNVVKIGVLTDMSGQFSHESGEGAVTAVRMAIEDFGGKVLGKPIELVVADHQNKPDIASGIARKWFDIDKVDMIANLINSSIALSVHATGPGKRTEIAIINGSGASRLTGGRLHAQQHPLCLRHLFAGQGHRHRDDEGRRHQLVFPHGGLCVRPCARSRYVGGDQGAWRSGAGRVALSGGDVGSIVVPVAGAGFQGARWSGWRVPAPSSSMPLKAAQEFGIQKSGQTLAGLLVWITDIKKSRAGNRAGSGPDQRLLLGP